MNLPADTVCVVLAPLGADVPAWANLAWLSAAERARAERLRLPAPRILALTARALLRYTLSQCVDVPPTEWEFMVDSFGKPHLQPNAHGLHFNVTHTDGLAAVAVARQPNVGIDAEPRTRQVNLGMAQRYFAPSEAALVEQAPATEQADVFLRLWTLKEAYVKACGRGLRVPLEQFAFVLTDPPQVTFAPELAEDPARWQFWQWATPTHWLALATPTLLRERTISFLVET